MYFLMKEKIIFLLILKTQSYYNIFSQKSKTSFSEKLFTQEFFREPEKRHFFFMHGAHADFEETLAYFELPYGAVLDALVAKNNEIILHFPHAQAT